VTVVVAATSSPGAQSTDTLRRYLDLLVDTLDEKVDGEDLARRAYLSRFHFDRVVRAAVAVRSAAGVDDLGYGDPIAWERALK
jgi:transcriptional regulator GlxA family with amidase domain